MSDLISRRDAIDAAKQHWYKPDIAKALEELPSAQQWILCSERPPEEDERVFVYLFDDSPYIAWFCGGRWHTEEFVLDKDEEPTEWMPLPEPWRGEGEPE